MVIPPTSEKNARFGTQGEFRQEAALAQRDQALLDQVNELNRQNAERRRLKEEQDKQNAQQPGDTPPSTGGGSGGSSGETTNSTSQ